jgi:hypothetical protein
MILRGHSNNASGGIDQNNQLTSSDKFKWFLKIYSKNITPIKFRHQISIFDWTKMSI